MPTLYIIAGPNGAGKTTFARRFLMEKAPGIEFVNADFIAQGLSPHAPETAAVAAGRLMLTRLRELAAQRVDFAFETTLSGKSYYPWLKEIKSAGYRVELSFLWLPVAMNSIERVALRVSQGGHHIPTDVIYRRHRRGLTNLLQLYRSVLDKWTIHINAESLRRIAQEENGQLLVFDMEEFAKINEEAHNSDHE